MRRWRVGSALILTVIALGVLCGHLISPSALTLILFAVSVFAAIIVGTNKDLGLLDPGILAAFCALAVVFGDGCSVAKMIVLPGESATVAGLSDGQGIVRLTDATVHQDFETTIWLGSRRGSGYRRQITVVPITGAEWRTGQPFTVWAEGPIVGTPHFAAPVNQVFEDDFVEAVKSQWPLTPGTRFIELGESRDALIRGRAALPLGLPLALFVGWSLTLVVVSIIRPSRGSDSRRSSSRRQKG